MPQTVEELLDDGLDAFLDGLGSTPYDADIETEWKNLFRDKVAWNLARANSDKVALLDLCTWMGVNAAGQISPDGWVRLKQLVHAYEAVRVEGYHRNGDHPTVFC